MKDAKKKLKKFIRPFAIVFANHHHSDIKAFIGKLNLRALISHFVVRANERTNDARVCVYVCVTYKNLRWFTLEDYSFGWMVVRWMDGWMGWMNR